MATWTSIADSVLEIGKPIRSIDHFALRDNIIAIMEKAAGAPQLAANYVVTSMITDANVTTAKIAAGNVTLDRLAAATIANFTKADGGNLAVGSFNLGSASSVAAGGTTGSFQALVDLSPIAYSAMAGTWRNISGANTTTFPNTETRMFQRIA